MNMSTLNKLVGEQLRLIREAKRLTQAEVAERTGKDGISKSRISDIERGQTNVTLNSLDMLLKALEVAPHELFDFRKFAELPGIDDKKSKLDILNHMLLERTPEEIQYVVKTAQQFIDVIDRK